MYNTAEGKKEVGTDPEYVYRYSPGADEVEALFPLLLLAEPSKSELRWNLGHLSDTVHRMDEAGQLVGAATMRWHTDPCEIVELAVMAGKQPGKALHVAAVLWYMAGIKRNREIALSISWLSKFGVDRFSGYRGLAALEKAGLVSVVRHRGRKPIVTLLNVELPCTNLKAFGIRENTT